MAKTITEQIILKVKVDTKSAEAGMDKFHRKIKPIEKSVKGAGKAVNDFGKKSDQASKKVGILGNAMKGIGAGLVIAKLKELGAEAITVSREFERIRLAMNTVFGSGALSQMAFIEAEAERLGLSVRTTASGFTQLAASTKKILTLKQTEELFTATAEASAALGLDAQKTGDILKALSQIAGKGTVSAEELRQQMGDHLPGAFDLAADSMGITTQELNKMLEQGELLAKDFLPKFADELKKTFHEGAMRNSKSEIAESTRNLNLWEKQLNLAGIELRAELTPAIGTALTKWEQMTDALSDSILWWTHSSEELKEMSLIFSGASMETENFTKKQEEIAPVIDEATKAMRTALDIVNKYQLAVAEAGMADDLRLELGLTEKGFSQVSAAVDEMIKKGLSVKQMLDPIQQLVEQLEDAKKITDEDFIKDKDVKKAKLLAEQLKGAFGTGLDFLKNSPLSAFFTPELDPFEEVQQTPANARLPAAGIQTGTAEAAAFLVRPMKDADKIAKQSLDTQKKIEKNTAKAAENPVVISGGSIN